MEKVNNKGKNIGKFVFLTLLGVCLFSGGNKEVNIGRQKMVEGAIPGGNAYGFVQEIQQEVEVYLSRARKAFSPELRPYRELLINYDRVLHDPVYDKGDGTGFGGLDKNMVYDRVLRNVGKEPNEVVYAIVDLAEDGEAELLIGDYWEDDEIYRPFIIYGNIDGKITPGLISEEYIMNIYEGGIIEIIAGKAMFEDFRYYKLKKNSIKVETIALLWADRLEPRSEEYIYYDDTADKVEISKEEFEGIIEKLTEQRLEIDWQPLEDFWWGK